MQSLQFDRCMISKWKSGLQCRYSKRQKRSLLRLTFERGQKRWSTRSVVSKYAFPLDVMMSMLLKLLKDFPLLITLSEACKRDCCEKQTDSDSDPNGTKFQPHQENVFPAASLLLHKEM